MSGVVVVVGREVVVVLDEVEVVICVVVVVLTDVVVVLWLFAFHLRHRLLLKLRLWW